MPVRFPSGSSMRATQAAWSRLVNSLKNDSVFFLALALLLFNLVLLVKDGLWLYCVRF